MKADETITPKYFFCKYKINVQLNTIQFVSCL